MKPDQLENSRETGKRVWESLQLQMAEANGFIRAMLRSLRHYIRKNFLWYIVFGIVGAGLATGLWMLQPKTYEADMTVSYVHYEKKIYADMLQKLNQLVQAGDEKSLAALLGMEEQQVSKIRAISANNIRNEDLLSDLSTEKVPFYIRVKVSDPGIYALLQPALVDYLNNTAYIQDRLNYMLEKSKNDLVFLEKRLAVVDSLSGLLIIRKEGINDEKAITRMELLQEALALHDRIQQVKGSMKFNLNIEVLDGFIPTEKPSGTGLTIYLLYGFLVGLALRFLWMIF